ncbi:hypothetical protein AVEN_172716-1 [Araneus ventricosus]|uniref:Uncharacterized protein n=1 Tax=Araneus ventricosus TaxID=182803 RepID=A0A4Y2U2X4_ARAVE|nr:hypothetical protein AVEN_122733-1 [Araneus ventricosus]GBO06006.1 hypothetical protein AVEN_172716-1 [Araneus ventricosus]
MASSTPRGFSRKAPMDASGAFALFKHSECLSDKELLKHRKRREHAIHTQFTTVERVTAAMGLVITSSESRIQVWGRAEVIKILYRSDERQTSWLM